MSLREILEKSKSPQTTNLTSEISGKRKVPACCAYAVMSVERLIEHQRELIDKEAFKEADERIAPFFWELISDVKEQCEVDVSRIEMYFGEALGFIREAEITPRIRAEDIVHIAYLSRQAKRRLDSVIFELEEAIKKGCLKKREE